MAWTANSGLISSMYYESPNLVAHVCISPNMSRKLFQIYTDVEISLHTILVKYYNDLLGRQSSERGRDEVTYFSVGDLGTEYANFQEKNFCADF